MSVTYEYIRQYPRVQYVELGWTPGPKPIASEWFWDPRTGTWFYVNRGRWCYRQASSRQALNLAQPLPLPEP